MSATMGSRNIKRYNDGGQDSNVVINVSKEEEKLFSLFDQLQQIPSNVSIWPTS